MQVTAAQQAVTVRGRIKLDTCIVAGGDLGTTEADGEFVERSKLQTAVAGDTGNRRLAVQVTVDERLHHVALEFFFQIQNIERKAEFLGYAPRIVNII